MTALRQQKISPILFGLRLGLAEVQSEIFHHCIRGLN